MPNLLRFSWPASAPARHRAQTPAHLNGGTSPHPHSPLRRAVAALACAGALFGTSVPAAALMPTTTSDDSTSAGQQSSLRVSSAAAAPTAERQAFDVLDGAESTFLERADQFTAGFVNDANAKVQWPFVVGVPLGDGFGPRRAPCLGCSTFHTGLDLQPGRGAPIQVVAGGIVREAGVSLEGLGVWAKIESQIDGRTVTSIYAHMEYGSLQLVRGQIVTAGDRVGNVGSSGQTTGPHLHLEIVDDGAVVDPYEWITTAQAGPQ